MLTRIITGFFLVVFILVPSILFVDTLFLPILCSLLSVMAIFEMLRCIGKTRHFLTAIPCYIIASTMPMLAHFDELKDIFGFEKAAGLIYTNVSINEGNEDKTYYATPYIVNADGEYVYGKTRAVSLNELKANDEAVANAQ